jgi:hypothetical protein
MSSGVITKKTSGLFGTGFLSGLTKEYKSFLQALAKKKSDSMVVYLNEINKEENARNGYVYPFKNDIYKFDPNYLGDLIIVQEVNLRRLIVTALSKQSFQQLKFSEILPLEASKVLNSALSIVIRYKRLYDLFFRAATVREIGTELFSRDRWFLEGFKTGLKSQYELPSVDQLETIVKYSLDIPFCLNIIFGINGLKQFDTEGRPLQSIRKNEYRPGGGNYKILLGESKKKSVYLERDGKIKDSKGVQYDVIGLAVEHFEEKTVEARENDPTEHIIDIMTPPKDMVGSFMTFIGDRFWGNEYLPTGDNWNLKWNPEDELLHQQFRLKFAVKLPEKIKPCPCATKMKSRRQVLELPLAKKSGGRTQRKYPKKV